MIEDDRNAMVDDSSEFQALVDAESRVMALQEAWLEVLAIRQSLEQAEKFMLHGRASGAAQCLRDVALFAGNMASNLHLKLHHFAEEDADAD